MKENSIEEDIKILEEFKTNGYNILLMKYGDRIKANFKLAQAIEHILSDYKRVLKINEVLLKENEELNEYKKESVSKQKVKYKIKELNSRIEKYREYVERGIETDVEWVDNVANRETVKVLQELLEESEE